MQRWSALVLVPALILAGCSEVVTEPDAPAEPQLDHHGGPFIGGQVYGPNGVNICTLFAGDADSLRVSLYAESNHAFAGGAWVSCPDGKYTINVNAPGTYRIMFRPTNAQATNIKMPDVAILGTVQLDGYVARDLYVPAGEAPYGRMTLGGAPIGLAYADLYMRARPDMRVFAKTIFTNGDGRWVDQNNEPLVLQRGMAYELNCSGYHGTTGTEIIPAWNAPQVFPSEFLTMKCAHQDGGRATNWTHMGSAMVLSMYPGIFGEHARPTDWTWPGTGWGGQFTEGGGAYRETILSDLFGGTFIISDGTRMIMEIPATDYGMVCDDYCGSEFVSTSNVAVANGVDDDRVVEWTYEATSGPFRVQQTSYDGVGGDYVLIRYLVRNIGAGSQTINMGWLMDWDVESNFSFSNAGATTRERRLAYTYHPGAGIYAGTLIIRKAAAGAYHWNNFPALTVAQQVDIMQGDLVQESVATSGDVRYFHSASAVTLAPSQATVLWSAVVAGGSLAEMEANADAAEAHVESLRASMSVAGLDVDLADLID